MKFIEICFLRILFLLFSAVPVYATQNWASYYSDRGQYHEALTEYGKAVALNPESAAAWRGRGLSYFHLREYSGALKDLNTAIGLNPGLYSELAPYLVKAYGKRGATRFLRGDYAGAISDFNEALKIEPDLPGVREARAAAIKARNDKAAAKAVSRDNFQAKPAAPAARGITIYQKAAGAGLLAGLSIYAYLLLRKASSGKAVAPAGLTARAKALTSAGKYEEARKVLAGKGKPDMQDYNLFLEIYIRLGDFPRVELILDQLSWDIKNKLGDKYEHGLYLALANDCRGKERVGLAHRLRRMAVDGMTALSVMEAPQTLYSAAIALENAGETELALGIYERFANVQKPYLDVAERYRNLKYGPAAVIEPRPPEPAPAHAALKTGSGVAEQVLDSRYELKAALGEGAMGVVYEACDRQKNQKVAVKKMRSWLKQYPEEYGRFRKEAQIVGRLKHPDIVGVQGVIEQGGDIYIVFDYVPGRPLADILKERKRFPFNESRDILKCVCEAVHYAHKQNVIHRDLKPSNIMLEPDGRAKVMDFGLSSELKEGLTRVTHQTMSGTLAYMAPEQHLGIVKRESDIYAIGVCLYEMLAGNLPFSGLDFQKQKSAKNYPEISVKLPWLPGGIDSAISRALEPDPSQRFADALDFYNAIKNL
ncbi:MAG: protein kinase [Elusimicrobia bacterium]|nr:protein kinase [Elusimicrobiota bacterium]